MRAVGFVLALAACGSSTSHEVTKPAPTAATVARRDADDPLAYLPRNAGLVFKVDVAALRSSTLGAKYLAPLLTVLAPSFGGCSYDPLHDISTLMIGIPLDGELGTFVVRGLDRAKTLECLRTSTVAGREEATFDGELVKLTNKSGAVNLFTFADANTLVMQGSKAPTKATLEQAIAAGAPLRQDPASKEIEERLGHGAVLSLVTYPSSRFFQKLGDRDLAVPMRAFRASLHVTDAVSLRGEVSVSDASTAGTIVDAVKPQLEQLRPFFDRYDVHAEGATLQFEIVLTEAQIASIVDRVKAIVGATDGR